MPIKKHKLDLEWDTGEEKEIARALRVKIYDFIEQKNINKEELGEKLQLLPMGVYNLFNKEWSLSLAIRMALLLKMNVLISLDGDDVKNVN